MNQINLVHTLIIHEPFTMSSYLNISEPYPTRIPQKFCGTPHNLFTLNFAQTITYFYKIETHPLLFKKGKSKNFLQKIYKNGLDCFGI